MSANMEGGHTCYQALGVSIKVSIISTRFYTPPCIFYNGGLCHSYKFSSQAVTCPKVTILQTLSCFCPQINTSVTVIFLLSTDDHTNYNGQRQWQGTKLRWLDLSSEQCFRHLPLVHSNISNSHQVKWLDDVEVEEIVLRISIAIWQMYPSDWGKTVICFALSNW